MSVSYDVTTPIGQVRLLAFDTDISAPGPAFQDEEIQALLSMNNSVVKLAAAQAVDALAGNEAYVQKFLKTIDVTTDGSKAAGSLQAYAAELRRQVHEDDGDATGYFDWAEEVYNEFNLRERVIKQYLRTSQ